MKELSIEEKAKRYDEALERAMNLHKDAIDMGENLRAKQCEIIFPELKESKESEDEKIRKALIEACKQSLIVGGFHKDKVIAWLEKQGSEPNWCHHEVDLSNCSEEYRKAYYDGWNNCNQQHAQLEAEQKPAWSEEEEVMLNEMYQFFDTQNIVSLKHYMDSYAKFIKSLKDRVQPQQEQKWSEEDEKKIRALLSICDVYFTKTSFYPKENKDIEILKDWLKSLRPQNWIKEDKERYISCLQRLSTGNPEQPETVNSKWFKEHVYPQTTWKPSDKQMEALKSSTYCQNEQMSKVLFGLYQDLKKLMEG